MASRFSYLLGRLALRKTSPPRSHFCRHRLHFNQASSTKNALPRNGTWIVLAGLGAFSCSSTIWADELKPEGVTGAESSGPADVSKTEPKVATASDIEDEAESEGAFNPETGEINWDCPCLGGMAHGPCGDQFREAFSCFVYSQAEPKGIECIDRFKHMQDCFRDHPDIYSKELSDDSEEGEDAVDDITTAGAASTMSSDSRVNGDVDDGKASVGSLR